jgi:tRNA threonylcarbamoyladenosine biosynthesis protein TsaB
MKLLALDTATEACSVALWLDGMIVERAELAGREHSSRLPLMVDAVLAEAGIGLRQLDGLVCGIGPGSFAGVRIGVSFIKGMALGLELPVAPVSSLAMLAQAALRESSTATVLAAIDARMGEVYFGGYRAEGGITRLLGVETVCPPQSVSIPFTDPVMHSAAGIPFSSGAQHPELDSQLRGIHETSGWIGVGTGWGAYGEALQRAIGGTPLMIDRTALPHAADGLRLVAAAFEQHAIDAAGLIPAYLRNNVALTKLEQAAAREAAQKPSPSA